MRKLSQLAAELAAKVPEMSRDSAEDNARLIEAMLHKHLGYAPNDAGGPVAYQQPLNALYCDNLY